LKQRVWAAIDDAVQREDRRSYDLALASAPATWTEADYLFCPERTLERAEALGWPVRNFPIHEAARDGDRTRVEREIEAGAPVDARNLWHETPAMLAARAGHADVLERLLELGADPALYSLGGRGLVFHAVSSWKPGTTLTALRGTHALSLGALPLVVRAYAEQRTQARSTRELAARVTDLLDTLRQSDRRSWRLVGTKRSLRPLLLATAQGGTAGDLQIFDWLVAHGIPPDLRDERGRTILAELATGVVSKDVLTRVVRAGVDVDSPDRNGQTALWHAVAHGTPAVIEALVELRARADRPNKHGWTPLMLATRRPKAEALPLLRSAAMTSWYERVRAILIEIDAPRPVRGLQEALLKAAPLDRDMLVVAVTSWRGSLEQLDALLTAGAGLEMRDPGGRTVLHVSIDRGEDLVRGLLDRGADPRAKHGGWTAADSAHMASDGGRYPHHVATARLLEAAAAAQG